MRAPSRSGCCAFRLGCGGGGRRVVTIARSADPAAVQTLVMPASIETDLTHCASLQGQRALAKTALLPHLRASDWGGRSARTPPDRTRQHRGLASAACRDRSYLPAAKGAGRYRPALGPTRYLGARGPQAMASCGDAGPARPWPAARLLSMRRAKPRAPAPCRCYGTAGPDGGQQGFH